MGQDAVVRRSVAAVVAASMLYVSCGGRSHDSPLGAGGAGRGGASAGMSAAAGKSGADGSAGSPSGLCACPAMPASQWIADESCVYEGTWGCPRSLKDALGYLVAETGGLWTRGCGRSVLAAPAAADEPNFCVYADDGSFVGAYRSEPKECPNVGMIATTGSELTCSSQTACWVGPGDGEGFPRCTDADAGVYLSPECIEYGKSTLNEAFLSASFGEDLTLTEYLGSIIDRGGLDSFTAVTGCGTTAIRWYGFGSTLAVFGADGQLIGFDFNGDTTYGPCDAAGYRRGVVPPDGCDHYHACRIAPDVLETGVVCACPCPDSPPENGNVTTTFECTSALSPPCGATVEEERALLESTGGWDTSACGFVTTTRRVYPPFREDQGKLMCAYDTRGALMGADHREPAPSECPGVDSWTSGSFPAVDCPTITTCWRGNPSEAPNGVPACLP